MQGSAATSSFTAGGFNNTDNNNASHHMSAHGNCKYSAPILSDNGCHFFVAAASADFANNQNYYHDHHPQHHNQHQHHHDYRSPTKLITFPNCSPIPINGIVHDKDNYNYETSSPIHQAQHQQQQSQHHQHHQQQHQLHNQRSNHGKIGYGISSADIQPSVHQSNRNAAAHHHHNNWSKSSSYSKKNATIYEDGSGENNNNGYHYRHRQSAKSGGHQRQEQVNNYISLAEQGSCCRDDQLRENCFSTRRTPEIQNKIDNPPESPAPPQKHDMVKQTHAIECGVDSRAAFFSEQQHYQYYYNYYYNRQNKFLDGNYPRKTTARKLPDPNNLRMSTNKKSNTFQDATSNLNHKTVNPSSANTNCSSSNNRQQHSHVLKEKMPNNIAMNYDERNHQFSMIGDHSVELKSANDDRNLLDFRIENELGPTMFGAMSASSSSSSPSPSSNQTLMNNNNGCDISTDKIGRQAAGGNPVTSSRNAKLPLTPRKTRKGGDESLPTKKSPAVGRVLIYSQSPRLSRSYTGVRLQEWRGTPSAAKAEKFRKVYLNGLLHSSKNKATTQNKQHESPEDSEPDDSKASDNLLPSSSSPPVPEVSTGTGPVILAQLSLKPNHTKNDAGCVSPNKKHNHALKTNTRSACSDNDDNDNDTNNNDDDDDDDDSSDEVDDDLDNVSDFDSDVSGSSTDTEDNYRTAAFKYAQSLVKSSPPSLGTGTTASLISSTSSVTSLKNPKSLLVPSLFPNVPPYLAFSSNTAKGPEVPADLYRILKWRVSNVMPKVVRHVLSNSGMRLLKSESSDETNEWMGVWGKHLKAPCFKTIRAYQKFNHLPGSFKIGRKDSLWKNLEKQMNRHGKREFGFMPKTFIFPNDVDQLRKSWPRYAARNVKWIIKPPASARGTGIRVVSKWAQIPKRKAVIVQKYIERPFLINGSKFDLRLYVLVTSINPLRVYLYKDGLARFASVKYSDRNDTLSDRCMHLTNYSINKFSSNYAKNDDVNACHGHKWTLKSLWTYLSNRGIRTDCLWEALRSLVLRTILSGESSINNMIKMNVESKYSVFELFGFDVLLDSDLIPWLLEVNISPSLHSELPLDSHVKAPLVQAVLNTALYHIPPKLSLERQKDIATRMSYPAGPICYDKRLYINYLSRTEKIKHNTFTRKTLETREEYLDTIIEKLTPDDVRCLIIAEDELARSAPLERIFPTSQSYKYLKFYENPRYYNRLLDAWEHRYGSDREAGIERLREFCNEKYHLQIPQPPVKKYFEDDDTVYYSPPEPDALTSAIGGGSNTSGRNTGM